MAMEIDRRTALTAGAFGLGSIGVGLFTAAPGPIGAVFRTLAAGADTPPPSPQVISSVDGVLQGTLTVTSDPAWLAGDPVSGTFTYNGYYPGPTLRAKPGDRILLDVHNDLDQMINTHFHGFHVTPEGQGDNVFAHIEPGGTFHHDFVIPLDHPGGLYWYHPHMHGLVDKQLYGGMAGLFVIEGGAAALPGIDTATHRLMALKNTAVSGVAPDRTLVTPEPTAANQVHVINGELNPTIAIAPGETQLWQIANVGNDGYYLVELDGHEFTVLAQDGSLVWETYTTNQIFLAPGMRREVAVTGGPVGNYVLRTVGYKQGPFGDWPPAVLAQVVVSGVEQTPVAVPAHPAPRNDLKGDPIANHRVIVMSESFDSATSTPYFYIDGVLFQNITPADVVQLTLDTTEEWYLVNDPSASAGGTAEDHPFHIHVNPMVVLGGGTWDFATNAPADFVAEDPKGTVDTVNVKPGEYMVVRMRFTDFVGRSVFHCHITFHEDMGMMGEIFINPAPTPPTTSTTAAPIPVVNPIFTG